MNETTLKIIRVFAIAAVLFSASVTRGAAQQTIAVDLELVLAVDTSASVDRREYDLQMQGLVRAFRDPEVIAAIRSTGRSGIAVTVAHWSSAHQQRAIVPWTQITNAMEARAFARAIEISNARRFTGSTGVGSALLFGERIIRRNRFDGRRKTIDISGDGPNNSGSVPDHVRNRVADAGVTINGLVILNEAPFLDRYFEQHVIAGPGAFVMAVSDYDGLAKALQRKLIREIASATAMIDDPLGLP